MWMMRGTIAVGAIWSWLRHSHIIFGFKINCKIPQFTIQMGANQTVKTVGIFKCLKLIFGNINRMIVSIIEMYEQSFWLLMNYTSSELSVRSNLNNNSLEFSHLGFQLKQQTNVFWHTINPWIWIIFWCSSVIKTLIWKLYCCCAKEFMKMLVVHVFCLASMTFSVSGD